MADYYVSSLATGSGTGTMASPWTPAQISGAANNDTVYAKADGTYPFAAGIARTSGLIRLIGYGTTPGDGTKATFSWTSNPASQDGLLNLSGNASVAMRSLRLLGGSFANARAMFLSNDTGLSLEDCSVENFPQAFRIISNVRSSTIAQTGFLSCGAFGYEGYVSTIDDCGFVTCGNGSRFDGQPRMSRCVFAGFNGRFGEFTNARDSIFYGFNGNPVMLTFNGSPLRAERCIFWNNAGLVASELSGGVGIGTRFRDCAMPASSFGSTVGIYADGTITLTADPFVNAAGGDFRLNSAAGGGALLTAAQFAMPGLASTIVKPWLAIAQSAGGTATPQPPREVRR